MGKKKKKGGGGGGEKKGPPPPNFKEDSQGPLEAMLSFDIKAREDWISHVEEEREILKDKNYAQKERNYHLRVEHGTQHKALVQEAQEHAQQLDAAEAVEKEEVADVLRQTLHLSREAECEIQGLECKILECNKDLMEQEEGVERREHYRDVEQYKQASYIQEMKQKMAAMQDEEKQLKEELDSKFQSFKLEVEKKRDSLLEDQKEVISEHLMFKMNKETIGELADTRWLKREVHVVQETVGKLEKEVTAMQQRNIALLESVQKDLAKELQAVQKLYRPSVSQVGGGSRLLADSTESLAGSNYLPSLTNDVATSRHPKNLGQQEVNSLALHGSRLPLSSPPDVLHLPPIEEQHCPHLVHAPRPKWPITTSMLNSVS